METGKIKRFATEARNKLKTGIAAKIITLGFDKNGNVPEHMHPQLMQGGSLWNGQLQTEGFYHQWQALYKRVQQKGIKEVYEEVSLHLVQPSGCYSYSDEKPAHRASSGVCGCCSHTKNRG